MFIPHTTSQRLLRIYERGKKQYKCDNSKFHIQHSSRFETRTPKQSKCRNNNPCDALQNKYRNALKEVEKEAEFTSAIKQARDIERAFLIQYSRGGKGKAVHALTRLALLSQTNAKTELILQELYRLEGSEFELPDFNPWATRKWKDDSGSFSIKAKVVSISKSHVILETEASEQITVPIIRLGKEEQALLKLIQP